MRAISLAALLATMAPAPAAIGVPPAPAVAAPRVAGTVRADTFWSQALGIRKRTLVWLPPSYATQPGRIPALSV